MATPPSYMDRLKTGLANLRSEAVTTAGDEEDGGGGGGPKCHPELAEVRARLAGLLGRGAIRQSPRRSDAPTSYGMRAVFAKLDDLKAGGNPYD